MKKLLSLSAFGFCSVLAMPSQAELSAAVDLSNLYLFRGVNLSAGSPLIAGTLNYNHDSGLYAGVWTASGDDAAGVEVDYYLGYNGQVQDLGYSVQYLNYYYPVSKGTANAIVDLDDWAELSLALSYQDIKASLTAPTKDDAAGEYLYYSLGYGYDKVSATLGLHDHKDTAKDYSHVDVKYQFNERVSFVVSQVLDTGSGSTLNDATLWQVNYQLPLTF